MTALVRLFSKALRNIIAKSPPSLPEPEAKTSIKEKINEFINTRITLAAEEIAKNAITKIREGDVILTYGRYVCFTVGSDRGLFYLFRTAPKFLGTSDLELVWDTFTAVKGSAVPDGQEHPRGNLPLRS